MKIANTLAWIGLVLFTFLQLPGYAETPQARFLRRDYDIRFDSKDIVVNEKARIRIESLAGQKLARIFASESPLISIDKVEIRILNEEGRQLQQFKRSDMERYCGYGSSYALYSDHCTYIFEPASGKLPFLVDYEIETRKLSALHFPSLEFQDEIPIDTLNFTFRHRRDNDIRLKFYGLDTVNLIERDADGWSEFSLSLLDIPETKVEVAAPPMDLGTQFVRFSPASFSLGNYHGSAGSWKEIGLWYNRLTASQYDVGSTGSALAGRALCDSIYTDLIEKNRYVLVQIGLGGWKPYSASYVEKNAFGDCKGLSTLLLSRLRASGITAYPVLVLTRDEGAIDPEFPNTGFNHLITAAIIGSDTVWMDPTCSSCPPGFLPQMDCNIDVLLITDSGGVIVRTPEPDPEESVLIRRSTFTINDSSKTTSVVTLEMTGHYASYWRGRLANTDEESVRRSLEDYFGGTTDIELLTFSFSGQQPLSRPLICTAEIVPRRSLKLSRQAAYLHLFPFIRKEIVGGLDFGRRVKGIDLSPPRRLVDSVRVTGSFISSSDSLTMPSDSALGSPFVDITTTYRCQQDTLMAVFDQTIRTSTVPADSLETFANFSAKRKKLVDSFVKLYRNIPASTPPEK